MRRFRKAVWLGAAAATAILAATRPPQAGDPAEVRSRPPAPTAEEEGEWTSTGPESRPQPAPYQVEMVVPRPPGGDAGPTVRRAPSSDMREAEPARPDSVREGFASSAHPQRAHIEAVRGGEEDAVPGPGSGGPDGVPGGAAEGDAPDPPPVLTPPVLQTPTGEGYPSTGYRLALDRDALVPQLRAAVPEGRVLLRILVRRDGAVARAQVAESSGVPTLDEAALRAAAGWTFIPAMRDGRAIDAWALVPVRFVLR